MVEGQDVEVNFFTQCADGGLDGGFVLVGDEVAQAAHQRQQVRCRQRRGAHVALQRPQPNVADLLGVLW